MKVIIMRGIPGSGKSTWARNNFPNSLICSTDNFMIDSDGNHKFDWTKLKDAHGACLRQFIGAVVNRRYTGIDTVIVDNTNIRVCSIAPYVAIAEAYNLDTQIYRCVCPPEVGFKRNVHGVPLSTVDKMSRQMENLPDIYPQELFVNTYKE